MTLSRAWLLGVALGALVAGAASAEVLVPDIHIRREGSGFVVKNWVFNPTMQSYTITISESPSISTSADFHKKVDILEYAWVGKSKCSPRKPEHIVLGQRKTAYALIHAGTSMGTINGCGDTLFKFQDVYYTLATKRAVGKTDYVKAALIVPFYQGSRVMINFNLNVSIGP